jgi:conjugative transfer region lipoprotein (TIGR03751 family)
VPWTDVFNRKIPTAVALAITLAGCANQDTLLPPAGETMLDIYRGAMTDPWQDDGEIPGAADVCQELALGEPQAACEQKIADHTARRYRQLDARPAGESLDYLPYTREVQTEIDNLFQRLENPDIVIYVYPHLATRVRAPIPGYSTVIPLYDQVQYRLPGESQRVTPVAIPLARSSGVPQQQEPQGITGAQGTTGTNATAVRNDKRSDAAGLPPARAVVADAAEGER